MEKGVTSGVFQVGIMVSDIDECLRLFCDTLGMKVVFDARNQIQPASGLSGNDHQLMHCLMLHGEGGIDLEIHQYVDPPAKPCPPMNHNDLGGHPVKSNHVPVADFFSFCERLLIRRT